jgi:hypothetical protein
MWLPLHSFQNKLQNSSQNPKYVSKYKTQQFKRKKKVKTEKKRWCCHCLAARSPPPWWYCHHRGGTLFFLIFYFVKIFLNFYFLQNRTLFKTSPNQFSTLIPKLLKTLPNGCFQIIRVLYGRGSCLKNMHMCIIWCSMCILLCFWVLGISTVD